MADPASAPLWDRLPPEGSSDPDDIFDRFLDHVASLGIELYPAQEEGILEMLSDQNIILNTPTGSGKSLVAAAMHFKSMAEGRRSFYTSPIKALVNEKFFDLCADFGPDSVGLLTGDASVNRDAPIVCCTAEVLANIALREGKNAHVDYAVLDEFHYYGDRERGVAWQVPLVALPQTTFLLMSATLGDMSFFERALTKLNGKPTAIVRSSARPVPLDFRYSELPLHASISQLVDSGLAPIYLVNFTQRACHEEAQNLMSVNVCSKEEKRAIAAELVGVRFDTPYGKDIQRFVRHGIGIHHGGLLPKYRRLVERLAQKGHLKVISGTDTLGVGVNIPIRTALFTRLCKFDGQDTRILSARQFHQIAGRAGRKGFDDRGSVVVQAPTHVAENLRLENKAKGDPGKKRKLVKRKQPTRGYKHWDRSTYRRLKAGAPEPLASRFEVSHAMLFNLMSRPDGGCQALEKLIRGCHDRPAVQRRHAKTAFQMLRSLVDADIMRLVPRDDATAGTKLVPNPDLQPDFSLNHTLSLYVVDAIAQLDTELESYSVDILSLVEAVLENPHLILRRQLDLLKRELLAELKADGVEYEDRMEELDKVEIPKPNAEFIYATFNEFAAHHPWVGPENIRPKGVAREMYDQLLSFHEAVHHWGLQRAEGLLVRYLYDVYKAVVQNVPEWARDESVEELIAYLHGVVYGVDSSLLDEWEKLRDPSHAPTAEQPPEEEEVVRERTITDDERAFTVLVRNAVFAVVRALAVRDYEWAATLVEAPPNEPAWTAERLEQAVAPFYEDHGHIRTDPQARGTANTIIDRASAAAWTLVQKLVDPEDHNDWVLELSVPLDPSRERNAPVVVLHRLGP